ncbi:hypothetical protein PIB30_072278 [Stylosanthes scabra]|uniref:Uncharacterized protein n=1 Tax=Stylosanthes scabra TaxID=79078 RepID=A0ABU6YPU7_9FABA|nr:hypothetical protein [Stylosanthes scabra]
MFLSSSSRKSIAISITIILLLLLNQTTTTLVSSKCTCDDNSSQASSNNNNVSEALKYKLIAMATTLVASIIGVCLPIMAKNYRYLNPENDLYLLVKSFAAGVILATGFIHILHDAFENLTSPCISEKPWGLFPFSGFVAMVAAIGTLIMEALVTGYHKRSELIKAQPLEDEDEGVHHHHNNNGLDSPDHLRNTIVSQILELAIVAHSIIVGVSLGVSQSPNTIKPLVTALSFHQCFEGMGLGACISQAQFKYHTVVIMVLFFCLTIPTGIGVGIGISKIYNEGSPKALIVEGLLLSASAGILIYMALVDLLASDFMNPKMLRSLRLQLSAILALLVGVTCMSLLVFWEGA